MEPVERPVENLISEKPATPFLSAIALRIFILVRLARSWVSPVNALVIVHEIFYQFRNELAEES